MTDGATMFKQRQRATWSAGNWDRVGQLIVPVGREVLAAADLEAGPTAASASHRSTS